MVDRQCLYITLFIYFINCYRKGPRHILPIHRIEGATALFEFKN